MLNSSADDYLLYSPHPPASTLSQWLEESNRITRHILENIPAKDYVVPQLDILNPPLWEFGHITWFHEYWIHRDGQANQPSWVQNADDLFNSSVIAHQDRWSTPIPPLTRLLEYNHTIVSRTQDLLCKPINKKAAYFIQLAILHQDMHNEAFAYMWQSMGRSMPFEPLHSTSTLKTNEQTWIHFSESSIEVGSQQGSGFIFDNEKWAHTIDLPAFDIASRPVSNGDYLAFLESQVNVSEVKPVLIPSHWKKDGDIWFERFFDQWLPLNHQSAVRHISHQGALRFCEHHHVRLPSEHELSLLMGQTKIAWQASNLWEWTNSTFAPFPGFSVDPYVDYSQPWFDGTHQVLKGGSPFTPDRLRRVGFRNFYQTHRNDHFCGFRTCLL